MRWFKHMSDLSRDEDVCAYLEAAGRDRVAAYGFLMLLMEAVACRMKVIEGDLVCSATYPITEWGRITYSHTNRVNKYLRLCEVMGWVIVEYEGSMCKVSIPKMVQWRDEYSRKSGHPPDKVAQSRTEQNRSEQREIRQDNDLSDCLKAGTQRRCAPPNFEVTKDLQQWAATNHPSVPIEKETAKFRLHEFSSPRSDWDNQWKLWIIRADEHRKKFGVDSSERHDADYWNQFGQQLRVARREEESDSEYCSRVKAINVLRLANMDG